MNKTSIEWTHRPETRGAAGGMTWNPIRARLKVCPECLHRHDGSQCAYIVANKPIKLCRCKHKGVGTFCTRISPGCTHCYASTINKRFGNGLEFTVPNLDKIEFFIDERILAEPLKQKKPCTIFAGDMNDIFHEAIPVPLIMQVVKVACEANWHTFQFLTKRADRMFEFFSGWASMTRDFGALWPYMWPRPNVWLGVSVESQKYADERIPLLLQTPAAVRFLSVEPQLEPVCLTRIRWNATHYADALQFEKDRNIDWVICGGESGHAARPMHPDWARSIRDQCAAANVPFFFKQWGEWQPHPNPPDRNGNYHGGIFLLPNGQLGNQGDWWEGRAWAMDRMGKKKSGALLDGREHREFPAVRDREAVTA